MVENGIIAAENINRLSGILRDEYSLVTVSMLRVTSLCKSITEELQVIKTEINENV